MYGFSCNLLPRNSWSQTALNVIAAHYFHWPSWYLLCVSMVLVWFPPGPYDKSYPSPSFCNPIPWKPIHVPPPDTSLNKTSAKKLQKQRKSQQSPSTVFRLRNTVSGAQLWQKRWHSRATSVTVMAAAYLWWQNMISPRLIHTTTAPEQKLCWVTEIFLFCLIWLWKLRNAPTCMYKF